MEKDMKLRKFIATTIREYLNEQQIFDNKDIWYHGTNNNFNVFDLSNFGKTDEGWWGIGVYFHSDIETAKIYGSNIIQVNLNTTDVLNLPSDYSGKFLFNTLIDLGFKLPLEYKDYSAMKIIKNIGKQQFTDFIKNYYDVMVINYVQGTKEAIVFNLNVIDIKNKTKRL
jgi:hypothetical protein